MPGITKTELALDKMARDTFLDILKLKDGEELEIKLNDETIKLVRQSERLKLSPNKFSEFVNGLDGLGLVVTDPRLLKQNIKAILENCQVPAFTEIE